MYNIIQFNVTHIYVYNIIKYIVTHIYVYNIRQFNVTRIQFNVTHIYVYNIIQYNSAYIARYPQVRQSLNQVNNNSQIYVPFYKKQSTSPKLVQYQ